MSDRIKVGESIKEGSGPTLYSPNGEYRVWMSDQLTLEEKNPHARDGWSDVWHSDSLASGAEAGWMEETGNFVLYYGNKEKAVWSTQTAGKGNKSSALIVKDQGNLVIESDGVKIFKALEKDRRPLISTPAPRLAPGSTVALTTLTVIRGGQTLPWDTTVWSPNGKIFLRFQDDGNLCVSARGEGNSKDVLLWSANTDRRGYTTAKLKTNGELVLQSSEGKEGWSSGSGTAQNAKDTVLMVQDDGHAIILSNGVRVWRTDCHKVMDLDKDRLNADEWLDINRELVSPNGKYRFRISDQRILELKEGDVQIWKSPQNVRLFPSKVIMRSDDNLWVGVGESRTWDTNTRRRKNNGSAALIVDDRGAVVIKSDGLTLWSSDTKKVPIDNFEAQQITLVANGSNRLRAGEYIAVGTELRSKNGLFIASLYDANNFNLWKKAPGPVWEYMFSSKTSATWASKFCLEWTGRLVIYGAGSKVLWSQGATSPDGEAELVLQESGNLVLSRGGQRFWESGTSFPALDGTTDRLKRGEWLSIGQALVSQNGLYSLTLLDNANIAIEKKGGDKAVTISAKGINGARLLHFNPETNDLEVYNKDAKQSQNGGKILWQAGNKKKFQDKGVTAFVLQNDGNAVVYVADESVWESKANLDKPSVPTPSTNAPNGPANQPTS